MRILANTVDDSGIIAISTNFTSNVEAGRERLLNFIQSNTDDFSSLMTPERKKL